MRIGAYYYAWYSGQWQWLRKTKRASDPPILGQYSNDVYGDVVNEHMRMAKDAGIDFLAISWDPSSSYGHVIDAAKRNGMKVTALYESLSRATGEYLTVSKKSHPYVLRDLESISEEFDEECWLRIDGKPVLIIYVSRNYEAPDDVFGEARKRIGDIYLVGDEVFWGSSPDPNRCLVFDALTSYNWYQPQRFFPGSGKETCDSFLENIRKFLGGCSLKRPYWPVAMPGYDDSSVRPEANHLPIPRLDGYLLRRSLQDAAAMNPDVVCVTSFCEWYEDTQVEPAQSYGNLYLDILKEFKHEHPGTTG